VSLDQTLPPPAPPRLIVAGLGGDSGKTLVAMALVHAAREAGLDVRAFKKGPDYIDSAWLAWASGRPARNLDAYLMGASGVREAFAQGATGADLAVIEGNRGLYDGADAEGTHSTAELAKILHAPVVLVVNATKMTRTLAACVLGCQALDPGIRLAGVVLNQVSGPRHERVIRDALERLCDIPVVGVVPRLAGDARLPSRHLGLVTPAEHEDLEGPGRPLVEQVGRRLALHSVLALARSAAATECAAPPVARGGDGRGLRIGLVRDSAFTFYYPENLESLETAGAEIVAISSLTAAALPDDLHALYIGGGFPETHAAAIGDNRPFLDDLRRRAEAGLPIYAECGGLMLLARRLRHGDRVSVMAGVLPCDVEVCPTPQGHGYAEIVVDVANPFFPVGVSLRGHEFHYSRIVDSGRVPATACWVRRGVGSLRGRDAIVRHNVWAAYTHLHARATPEWATGLLGAARACAKRTAASRGTTAPVAATNG